jgi:hypothetical protein
VSDQDGLYLRSETKSFRSRHIIERFNPEAIPGQHEESAMGVPEGKTKHSPQATNTFRTQVLIKMNDDLYIGVCTKAMAGSREFLAKFEKIVNFPIADYGHNPVLIGDRLIPCVQVNHT